MSVELEVRLRNRESVDVPTLIADVRDELCARFAGPVPPIHAQHRMTGGHPGDVMTGSIHLELDGVAALELLCYYFGSDDVDEGGWWVTLSPARRSPEDILLMTITSACLARLLRVDVLDDALLLGKTERWVSPADVLSSIGSSRTMSFVELASQRSKPPTPS